MKRAIVAVSVMLASCASPAAEPREYTRLPETTGQESVAGTLDREPLRDGPRMVVRRDSSPLITVRVLFDAGSASDEPGREGITNLTARLMAEGAAGDLTFAERSRRLYPMAGSIDVHVGRDATAFIGQVHRDHVDAFYELFRDVLLRPRMQEDDFARVRDQARNALLVNLRNADDEELGKEALHTAMYEGHPYAHPVLGTVAGLNRLRVDDARAHRNRVFCGGRAIVGISGNFPDELVERIERDLSALRSDACVGRAALPPAREIDGPRVLIVNKPAAQSVAVSMGFPIEVRRDHPDYPALVLAGAWLGQHRQFVGRLMQSIRGERGLNYGDYAYVEQFTQEGWSRFPLPNDVRRQQHFSIWLRPLRPETAHFAIRLAVRELRRLHENGLSEAELDRIRTFADRYYALYLQTSSRRLGFAMDDVFYGADGEYLERLRAAWRELDADDVNAAIRRHLRPDQLRIAIVAPDAEALANAIASEAESPINYRSSVSETVRAEDREIVRHPLGIPRDGITVVPLERTFAE